MRVRSPSQKDPLEEGMAPHSSIVAWRIPWTEEPGGQIAKSQTRLKDKQPVSNINGRYHHPVPYLLPRQKSFFGEFLLLLSVCLERGLRSPPLPYHSWPIVLAPNLKGSIMGS